jgi:hypothetical protein
MKSWAFLLLVACGHDAVQRSTPGPGPGPVPQHDIAQAAGSGAPQPRMMPPEAFLRAYLTWFGGILPEEVPKRGGHNLFDQWNDYLGALGLPDYRLDMPRIGQSNALMLAAVARLGEALCVRSVEHDLHARAALEDRVIFAFDMAPHPTLTQFADRFDILHRTFIGYPASLAPKGRVPRFYSLYQQVAAQHEGSRAPLTADEAAWAAVCTALVQHPEARIY